MPCRCGTGVQVGTDVVQVWCKCGTGVQYRCGAGAVQVRCRVLCQLQQ